MAVGHTILVIAYHLLKHGGTYEDLGANYFDERDRQAVQAQGEGCQGEAVCAQERAERRRGQERVQAGTEVPSPQEPVGSLCR